MNSSLKEKISFTLKEIICGLFQIFFSRIHFFNVITPVGLPFAIARLNFGGNIFFVSFFYFISSIYLMLFNFENFIIVMYEIVFLALYFFVREFFKTNKNFLLLFIFTILSNAVSLYFCLMDINFLGNILIGLILECFSLIYFYKLFQQYQKKFIFCKFSRMDYFLISIFILLLSVGLFSYKIIFIYCPLLFINLVISILSKIFKTDKFVVYSIIFSFGTFLAYGETKYVLYTVFCVIFLIVIKDLNKILFAILSTVIFIVSMFIFKLQIIISICSIMLGLLIFVLIPKKIVIKLNNIFGQVETNYIYKVSNDNRIKSVQNKLVLMSNTLLTMKNNFKFLLVGKIDRNKACSELAIDVINNCCGNCEYYQSCFMGTINKKFMFEELIKKAIEYGTLNSNDLSNGIQSYCNKSLMVINEVNRIAKTYLSYESAMKSEDESKLVISNELENFSSIFLNFSTLLNNFPILNEKLSLVLKEKLLDNLIDVKEVAIFENKNGIKYINIISSNEQILRKEMKDTIYKVIKNNVKLKEAKHIDYSGLSYATFLPVNKIQIKFSVATKSKEQKNGDNVVVQKIDENKYFIAIADGMGHGEKANKISSMVLSLIKSLFEVGFNEDLVIQSVNKLLLPAGLDNFTTLDACVIDLESEFITFVKLGSSVSVIKHKNTSELVKCESLPIGMIQNIKPTIIKKQIISDDMIFLASDGIVDSFNSIESYKNFINDAEIFDMKKFLDDVIFDAEFGNTKHKDDMTIIGINLLKNSKK